MINKTLAVRIQGDDSHALTHNPPLTKFKKLFTKESMEKNLKLQKRHFIILFLLMDEWA